LINIRVDVPCDVNVIRDDVLCIDEIGSVHHVSPISWIGAVFSKIDNLLHVPHVNVQILDEGVDVFKFMAWISILCFTLASIDVKLKTFGDHGSRIPLNNKTVIWIQVWTNQTKPNPALKVVSL
jgi:hypothetical protein